MSVLPHPREWLRTLRELGHLGPLALSMFALPLAGTFALAASAPHWWPLLRDLEQGQVLVFLAATVLCAGLCLIPTHASSLVAGLLFGPLQGIALALFGTGGAALLGYTLLRRLAGTRTALALAQRPRAAAVHAALFQGARHRTAGLVALIRLSPAMPFAATNLLMAAAGVSRAAFLCGTLAGIAPRVVAVVLAGAASRELDLSQGADRRFAVLGLLATVVVIAVVGRMARRALLRSVDSDSSSAELRRS